MPHKVAEAVEPASRPWPRRFRPVATKTDPTRLVKLHPQHCCASSSSPFRTLAFFFSFAKDELGSLAITSTRVEPLAKVSCVLPCQLQTNIRSRGALSESTCITSPVQAGGPHNYRRHSFLQPSLPLASSFSLCISDIRQTLEMVQTDRSMRSRIPMRRGLTEEQAEISAVNAPTCDADAAMLSAGHSDPPPSAQYFAKGGVLRPFRLLKGDLYNLRRRYVSDWVVFNQQVFASSIYIFFTNILPGITFASDLYVLTGKSWGTIEVVLSTGLCGTLFAV